MDVALTCPFCAARLRSPFAQEPSEDSESPMGGVFATETYACPRCDCWLRHEVVRKLANVHDSWELLDEQVHGLDEVVLYDRAALRFESKPPESRAAACPDCHDELWSAMPPDAPAVVASASSGVSIEHVCRGCRRKFKLEELRRWSTLRRDEDSESLEWVPVEVR